MGWDGKMDVKRSLRKNFAMFYFLLSINIDLWDCRDVFCRFKVGGELDLVSEETNELTFHLG